MKMVSIIIPIYNVKSFIGRGLSCVLSQTYQNFEIILSDDGSSDGSYEECLKWANKDPRIRVLHQANHGAGAARNLGLKEAKGDYVYFFDIDDEISPSLLEYCVTKIMQDNYDFICFGYENVETTYKSKTTVEFPETIINNNDELKRLFVDFFVLKVNGFPWNKFYRKAFLDKYQIRYEDQRIQQDEVFNLKCYRYLDRAYISPKVLYTYYIYEKGNTRSRFIADRFDIYKSVRSHFDSLKEYWQLSDPRLEDYLNGRFYKGVLQCLMFNLSHPNCQWTMDEKKNEIRRIMADCLTQDSFLYAKSHFKDLENRIYQFVCRQQNYLLIYLVSIVFDYLHKLRKSFR